MTRKLPLLFSHKIKLNKV